MENLVETVLHSISSIKKPQRIFMTSLLAVFTVFQGRATYRNLSRYCSMSEKRFSRWYARDLTFSEFNARLLQNTLPTNREKIAMIDASFLAKSGRHTEGLGWFYNGSAGEARYGLEISMIRVADPACHTAYALDARQTPDREGSRSRTEYYMEQLVSQATWLRSQGIRYVTADACYSKASFVSGVLEAGLDMVGKFARMRTYGCSIKPRTAVRAGLSNLPGK